jgi:hypothetical protein
VVARPLLVWGIAGTGLLVAVLPPQVAAEPTPTDAGTVGTAVHVVIHQWFQEVSDPDQCVGAASLAAIRRGSSVVLSEGSFSGDTRKVAIGQFFRSRMKDGMCEALYITSAPVMPSFNAQFVGPERELSPAFGPVESQPVTDQPGIQQAVRIDLAFEPQA